VFNGAVSRRIITCALICAIALACATVALARRTEVGRTAEASAPSCPTRPCLAVSRTTGYQAKVGPTRGVYTIPRNGRIVAWSITLGKPGKKQTAFFSSKLGGPASAGISILRPGPKLTYRVVAASPVVKLEKYFGRTVQFPLVRSLAVRKGYVVALTVPTWAPALAVGLGGDHSWRASRARSRCDDTQTQTAQRRKGALAQYICLYRTARLTYSATLISTP
jgi:hypothetical protein